MTSSNPLVDPIFANQVSWLRKINTAGLQQPIGHEGAGSVQVAFAAAHMVTMANGIDDLNEAVSILRRHDHSSILAWAARPDPATDRCLHARGFRESFAPTWMWHDLSDLSPIPHHDTDVFITPATLADRDAYLAASDVPYINQETSGGVFDRVLHDQQHSMMLLAWSRDSVIGTGALHVTASRDGMIGGVYNIAVAPNWRRRGIATAITLRLLHLARERSAIGACLNATPEGKLVYERIGFRESGHGQTWFLPDGVALPSPGVTADAEVLGRGDVTNLDPSIAHLETMPNGESPVRFAARFGQSDAIRWLLDRGAEPDIHPLWSRGFRREAVQAMADPEYRDRLWGTPGATALHDAVRANDKPLVLALLDAGADRTVRDAEWKATPVEWARVLGRARLTSILISAGAPDKGSATD